MLAVSVDYEKQQAVIGTKPNEPIPREQIVSALKSIGYRGEFTHSPTNVDPSGP